MPKPFSFSRRWRICLPTRLFDDVIMKYGKPDVLYTGFVSIDMLFARPRKIDEIAFVYGGRTADYLTDFLVQIQNPFFKIASQLVELGFDGIDINMGCPDKAVMKRVRAQ